MCKLLQLTPTFACMPNPMHLASHWRKGHMSRMADGILLPSSHLVHIGDWDCLCLLAAIPQFILNHSVPMSDLLVINAGLLTYWIARPQDFLARKTNLSGVQNVFLSFAAWPTTNEKWNFPGEQRMVIILIQLCYRTETAPTNGLLDWCTHCRLWYQHLF